jgi:adenylate cyclase
MAEERVQRRLAAILAADVVGYSRLMREDEAGTRVRFNSHLHELIEPAIASRQGRTVKTTGDGLLVEFASVVDAVECAVTIQKGLADRNADEPADWRMDFRIGINLGDVIIEGDDIHGDGVNVAARLEGISEPGGICISANVFEQVQNRLELSFEDLGEQQLKNIPQPIRAYRVDIDGLVAAAPEQPVDAQLMEKSAVAVLPFNNMSGDPEQEYFADGLTEDIITSLSLWRSFPVIARNSTFAYKGKVPDIRRVAKELGARYVIEGSVRKGGDRVRITAQLIDAATGHHIWAERFDRKLEDIFELQDKVTERIVATVSPELERAEQKRSATKAPTNHTAWDLYHRGMSLFHEETKEGNAHARKMFDRAIELDPSYSQAYSGLSLSYARDLLLEYSDDRDQSAQLSLEAAQRAVNRDDSDSFAHTTLSIANMWPGEFELSISAAERAVDLNPNSAFARNILGTALDNAGRSSEAVSEFEKSIELNPRDPQAHITINTLARCYLNSRNYEQAAACAQKAIGIRSNFPNAYHLLASALGHLGRLEEARKALVDCERVQPGFVEKRFNYQPYRDAADNEHIHEGVRKAGQPE